MCDHAPVCVSLQSVHASVPLIILIWRCLLLACLVGDKAEGLPLSHTQPFIIRLAGQRRTEHNFHVHKQSAFRMKSREQKKKTEGEEDEQGDGKEEKRSNWMNKVLTEKTGTSRRERPLHEKWN